jgi:cytochrome d ubiquinol oxidase subunit II
VLGNVLQGIYIDESQEVRNTFFSLLNPYAFVSAIMVVFLFAMHGALYLILKTEENLQQQIYNWIKKISLFFISIYSIWILFSISMSSIREILQARPWILFLFFFQIFAIFSIFRETSHRHEFRAFLFSCLFILTLGGMIASTLYPNFVHSETQWRLTVYNSSSSSKTLSIMFIIAAIGVPLILAYTIAIYWIFKGKVKMDSNSY